MSADDNLWLNSKSANLDAQGRLEAAQEQAESFDCMQGIETRANARMVESGEKGTSTVIGLLGFTRSRNVHPLGEFPLSDEF